MRYPKAFLTVLILGAAAFLHAQNVGLQPVTDTPRQGEQTPSADEIVSHMLAQGRSQSAQIVSYEVHRHFNAANLRFNLAASLDVLTNYHAPSSYQSVVINHEGSSLIREQVFDKILETEKELQPATQKAATDIVPQNYMFGLAGTDDCGGRLCYRLSLTPRRKSKYLINGYVWVDGQDYAIVKVQGSPSKKPSFWTESTEVTRTYTQIHGIWMTDRIDSSSELFLAGHSTLSIQYSYDDVRTNSESAQLNQP